MELSTYSIDGVGWAVHDNLPFVDVAFVGQTNRDAIRWVLGAVGELFEDTLVGHFGLCIWVFLGRIGTIRL
jgi:hypothetical protein